MSDDEPTISQQKKHPYGYTEIKITTANYNAINSNLVAKNWNVKWLSGHAL